jgi:hypothetical protein
MAADDLDTADADARVDDHAASTRYAASDIAIAKRCAAAELIESAALSDASSGSRVRRESSMA